MSEIFKSDGNTAEISMMTERRIKTLQDLIEVCEIDTNIWEVEKWTQGKTDAWRKDRSVIWVVKDGKVQEGNVNDTGKILMRPTYQVKAWLVRKTIEIRNRLVVDDFIKNAKKYSPKYKRIQYKPTNDGCLYEIGLPDLQLGRLVMASEAGYDISPKIQIKKADMTIDKLVGYASTFSINRILFPVGNDFFDANTAEMRTVHGTLQQDDVRWQKTFALGSDFMVRTIDKLSMIAPVDIMVIPGNHDEERIFYLGSYLSAWYHNNPNVKVDNEPRKRKYYSFGSNLIGLTHGYYEKNNKLDALMAYEVPILWSKSTHREWHLGHTHHKADMIFKTDEFENGVVVRVLRSLSNPSVWEFDKGLVGSQKAVEAFLWHPTNGVVAQFTA